MEKEFGTFGTLEDEELIEKGGSEVTPPGTKTGKRPNFPPRKETPEVPPEDSGDPRNS